jgi:DNA-directed RNA polymerase
MTDIRERIGRQLELEGESRQLGAERYRSQRPLPWRTEASSADEEAELPPGRQLLKLVVPPMAAGIREFVDRIANQGAGRRHLAYKALALMEPEAAAYLSARVIVNSTANGQTAQATAFSVAEALAHHIEMVGLHRVNKKGYKGLLKKQEKAGFSSKKKAAVGKLLESEGVRFDLSQSERLHTGMKLIELLCDVTGLFVLEEAQIARGFIYKVRPTEACRDWLERQHARCEMLEPIHLPMVVRPRAWRTPFWGGYLTKRPGLRLLKQWNTPYHDELKWVDMPEVYRAVNNVQNTPWRINRTVLDVMRRVWDGGGNLGGLPRREDLPLPVRPEAADTDEAVLKQWKADAADVYTRNGQLLSKRLAVSQRLWIAQKFVEEEAIYFPHELDFRGRIYPVPVSGPHPQGEDTAKALIEFAEGHSLGPNGAGWLAIHVANLFGVDKVPFEERVDWVMANSEAICDSAENPLDGSRFWTTADSPYCALAACIEWAGYCREGEAFVSRVPVALDGSNSGLQHFSAMLRDPVGARAVNLMPSERPQDIYKEVAAAAQATVNASPLAEAVPWKGDKVTRKIAKQPCMTYCYSATRFGMQGMVLKALRDIDSDLAQQGKPPHLGGEDNYQAAMYQSHVLWGAISDVVSAAAQAMEWLREAAKVAGELGLPIWWTTPVGLPVLQGYRTVNAQRVLTHYQGRALKLVMAVDGEHIDKRAQANGIAPNFVHSLDAAHLMSTVNACADQGIVSMAVIHDSFGCHAAFAGDLSRILRETFVEQYTPNRLEMFRDELAAQLPPELAAKLPPLPEVGTFDLNQVLDSHYVFA